MPSITSWTDSNVSNNLLNLTTLSEISEVLTSKTNIADPKHLTKALLSGGKIIYDILKKNKIIILVVCLFICKFYIIILDSYL